MRAPASIVALCCLAASALGAQGAGTGTLEGTVAERVAPQSARRAVVTLTRLDREPVLSFTATPDSTGRYRIDSLPAGAYELQLDSPLLDSLELSLAPRSAEIAADRTTHIDLALPSGAQLRDAVCPGLSMGAGLAAVAGRTTDADTEQPLAGADVLVSWTEVQVDRTTLKATRRERAAAVKSGARGEYRLCGVPSGTSLALQLQRDGRAGTVIQLVVSEEEGAAARDLSMSAREAPTLAALDSAERLAAAAGVDSVTGELLLTGTASIAGRVRGANGLPIEGAQVHVRDSRGTVTTGADGAFVLGSLPSGTQVLVVRRLGYALAETTVDLREGRRVERDLQLSRAVSLDSVRVTALGTRFKEFDFARGANVLGRFLTRDQIERRHAAETGDLLAKLGGFTVVGRGKVAQVYTKTQSLAKRDPLDDKACHGVNVVIDGVQGMGINDVPPALVVGLEAYTGPVTFSTPYRMDCGAIVIWTTAWRRDAAQRAPAPR
jgi:hypothetical protein